MKKFKVNDILINQGKEVLVVAIVDNAICLGSTEKHLLQELKWFKIKEIQDAGFTIERKNVN